MPPYNNAFYNLQAMRRAGKEPFPVIYQDAKADSEASKAGQLYEVVAKAQLKKQTKIFAQEQRKMADREKKEKEEAEAQAKRAEEARKITIEEDKTLAEAKRIRILQGENHRDQRVKVFGWVHRLRRQGKIKVTFLLPGVGTAFCQFLFSLLSEFPISHLKLCCQ